MMRRLSALAVVFVAGCAALGRMPPAAPPEAEEAVLRALVLDEHDDAEGALRAYVALLAGPARTDPSLAAMLLDRLDALVAAGRASPALAVELQRLDVPALSWETRRGLSLVGARLDRMAGDEAQAQAAERRAGCRQPWQLGAPIGPLARLDLSRPLEASVFRPEARSNARARGCRVLFMTPDGRPGAVPAALSVTLATAGDVELLVGGDQPHRVWVDEAGGAIPDERASAVRRRTYRLRLSAGTHRVVVVAAASHGRIELELALLAPPGARVASYEASGGGSGTSVVSERREPERDARRPGLIAGYLALADAERAGDVARMRGASTRLVAHAARVSASAAAIALALVARVAAEDPTVPARIARDRSRRFFEKVLSLDPRCARARYEAGRLALERDRAREALELAQAAPAPVTLHAALLMSEALRARNRDGEVGATLEPVRKVTPQACALVEALLTEERLRHRPVDLDLARRAARCRPGSTALADALRQRGELAAAVLELRRIVLIDPVGEGARSVLGETLAEAGQLAEAVMIYRDLVATARRSATYRLRLVDALLASARIAEARAALTDGLALDPESAELVAAQRSLLRAQGRPEAHAYALDRVDGRAAILAFEASRNHYEGAAVFVLDRTVSRVYPTGGQRTLTHNIVKVLAKEGIDRWGEWTLPENAELLTVCAWKPDGRRLEPEEIPEKESISLPGLAVGDYVEIEYVERAAAPAAFPGGFLTERFYFASFDAPLDRSEYLLVTPRDWPVTLDQRGGSLAPVLSRREEPDGAVDVRTFGAQHVPQRRAEPSSVPAAEFLPSVRASARVELAGWRDYLAELAWGTRRADSATRELATSLVVGARDEAERLGRLDRWVRGNVKQGGTVEESATAILARREGNRATLLAALAEAVGVRTRLLLARSRNKAAIPLDLEGFDALLVELGGTVDDPRPRYGRPGELSAQLRGATALALERGAAPISLPVASSDHRAMKVQMTLDADGSGHVQIEERLRGWPAVEWRESLSILPADRVRPQFEQRTLAHFFPGATLESLSWEAEADPDLPFVVRYALKAPGLARRLGEALVLPAPFAAVLSRRYATSTQRQSPVFTEEVAPTELELDVTLSPDLRATPAPAWRADSAEGQFSQEVRVEGNHLKLRSRFFLPLQRILPGGAARFVSWAEAVDRAEAEAARLTLVAPSGTAGSP